MPSNRFAHLLAGAEERIEKVIGSWKIIEIRLPRRSSISLSRSAARSRP